MMKINRNIVQVICTICEWSEIYYTDEDPPSVCPACGNGEPHSWSLNDKKSNRKSNK